MSARCLRTRLAIAAVVQLPTTSAITLGGGPVRIAPGLKVCVFRDYDETIAGSEHPNRFVWFCIQANISDMQRSRVNVPDHLGQALRNILVKEELHAPSRTRFSSEAAAHS